MANVYYLYPNIVLWSHYFMSIRNLFYFESIFLGNEYLNFEWLVNWINIGEVSQSKRAKLDLSHAVNLAGLLVLPVKRSQLW